MRRSERPRALAPLEIRGRRFEWGARTYVMGIINATPDSFSGDGIGGDVKLAVERALEFTRAGADVIDVGGESTRPGHAPVSEDVEAQRVLPVIKAVRARTDLPISIDTFKPKIAAAALSAGADIVNCVWGAVIGVVDAAVAACAPLIVMHNKATAEYHADCTSEVIASLERAALDAVEAGVPAHHIIVDPGIGFGKTADHNIEILARLPEFVERLPYPLLIGTSRKSFIGKITGLPVEQREFPTAATVALTIAGGADIVRVHDVADMMAVVEVADAICRHGAARAPEERFCGGASAPGVAFGRPTTGSR